ncbi:MAG: hypothetical protein Q4E17_01435 [Synergistes sp.]|nr:hypothetical protein [Synergistes sp.]
MTKIQIHYAQENCSYYTVCESTEVRVDLSAVDDFYRRMGERQHNNYLKFLEFWQSDEGEAKLLAPKALVKTISYDTFKEVFGDVKAKIPKSINTVVMAVWTIGIDLEKKSSELTSAIGSMMTGLLVDVAGSVALYKMHDILFDWIRDNITADKNKFICGEYYPGIGSMRQDLMENIIKLGNTFEEIGVKASGTSLLHPRKSQCSFIGMGNEAMEFHRKAERCIPCNGKRCLYYQLGGCHVEVEHSTKY